MLGLESRRFSPFCFLLYNFSERSPTFLSSDSYSIFRHILSSCVLPVSFPLWLSLRPSSGACSAWKMKVSRREVSMQLFPASRSRKLSLLSRTFIGPVCFSSGYFLIITHIWSTPLGAWRFSKGMHHWARSSSDSATCSVEPGNVEDLGKIVRIVSASS